MTDASVAVVRRSEPFREGEDLPLQAQYTDDSGAALAPDGAADSSGPTVTVTAPDGTDVVSGTAMTESEVGTYEHVWDTATDTAGTGKYVASVSAELSGETDIETAVIEVQ